MLELLDNMGSLKYFLAELWLVLWILVLLIQPLLPRWSSAKISNCLAVVALIGAAGLVLALPVQDSRPTLFFGMLALDGLSRFFKILFVFSTLVTVLMTLRGQEVTDHQKPEFYAILLGILLGMFLTAASMDLLMMYLSIELFSLGSYILAGFSKNENRSDEAAMKFLLYGSLSTGAMLFGMTYLYGMTGSTQLLDIREYLAASGTGQTVFFVAFLLIFVGIGYKISAVPFHFWAPDVYEGSPSVLVAFLSVASKAAGFAAFIRLFYTTLLANASEGIWTPFVDFDWRAFVALLAMVTMTFGNLGAFRQENIKRLFAYSGIAHAGYILVGAIALTTAGVESILFYLLTYFFTNFAAFAVIVYLADRHSMETIEDYRDLGKRSPLLALALAFSLFSLIGVPPLAGFLGKWYLFAAAVQTLDPWCIAAVVVGLLNTVLSVYYYMRIIKAMYLDHLEAPPLLKPDSVLVGMAVVLSIPVVFMFFAAGSIYEWTRSLSYFLVS
ncbi:MAG: NADH-quinone oxidoreductase subunit N [Candidatus Omnitrophica bacterium]|nr:NADH-quinone oxidoreductase subunit N [Candidatus Omnitrophota bacterium]